MRLKKTQLLEVVNLLPPEDEDLPLPFEDDPFVLEREDLRLLEEEALLLEAEDRLPLEEEDPRPEEEGEAFLLVSVEHRLKMCPQS